MRARTLLLALLPLSSSAFAQGLVPLPLELPKPLFVGTPVPVKVPNIEKPLGTKRPPFLAPAGTVNLARGKAVSTSDPYPIIGEVPFVTDGVKSGTEGSYVELAPGVQWVQIDLGEPSTIYAIVCWHFHAQARAYFDVVVKVAGDAEFKTAVTVYNNDTDDTSGLGAGKELTYVETSEGRLIDAKGVRARYVRLYSNGNTMSALNHYVEVEVFGKR